MSAQPYDELVDVWLLEFPLDVYQRAQEHGEGLIREFTLIAQERASRRLHEVPERLMAIVDELGNQFRGVSLEPERLRDEAIAAGEATIDLHYQVPRAAAEASRHLGAILDEADDYCRAGEHLLSLATPPEAKRFRDWFLGEFISQIDGGQPVPWTG